MFYIDNEAQPEKFSSIPDTLWWGIATLTTVGYKVIYPVTSLRKFLGGLIALCGILFFALPAGIISSGFFEIISEKIKNKFCLPALREILQRPLISSADILS